MNLNQTIQSVLDDYDETDPHALADLAWGRIEEYDRDRIARFLMSQYVMTFIARTRSGPQPASVPSKKVAAIREAHEAWLRERISVAPGVYKMMGDCTAADLRYAAEKRRELAAANMVRAEQYDALADDMERNGAATVRDLGPSAMAA